MLKKDDLREKILFKNFRWTSSKYYDYPDGQDLMGKLAFTTKAGFFAGAFGGMFIATRSGSKPALFRTYVLRAMIYTVPCVAAPIAFTTVTYFATNIRKKDDQINYLLGSIAAAVVGANLAGLSKYTVALTLLFSAVGVAKKTAQMHGTLLFPPSVMRVEPPYYQRVLNTSLVPDGEPEWTKYPPTDK